MSESAVNPVPTTPTSAEYALWFRQTSRNRWVIVGQGKTLAEVVALIGCGGRVHGGDWMPLVAGKHPDDCGAPDRPRKKATPVKPTPSSFGISEGLI